MARMLVTLFLGCSLAAFACKKSPGPPSPDWEQARSLHVALVARHADDAYGRPEMDDVLALLERVAPDSVDAPEAAALKVRILEQRKRLAAEKAERDRMLSAAGPGSWSPSAPSGGGLAEGALPAKPALVPGLALDAFREAHGDCFDPQAPLRIERSDGGLLAEKGDAFRLKGDPACKERYAELADKMVLFTDGKLLAVRPASDVKEVTKRTLGPPIQVEAEIGPDGGLVPKRGADGGYIPVMDGGR